MTPAPFSWARAMGFGFGVLRLSSAAFWRLTPRELAAAMTAVAGDPPPPLDRASLEALTAAFPDAGGGARSLQRPRF